MGSSVYERLHGIYCTSFAPFMNAHYVYALWGCNIEAGSTVRPMKTCIHSFLHVMEMHVNENRRHEQVIPNYKMILRKKQNVLTKWKWAVGMCFPKYFMCFMNSLRSLDYLESFKKNFTSINPFYCLFVRSITPSVTVTAWHAKNKNCRWITAFDVTRMILAQHRAAATW